VCVFIPNLQGGTASELAEFSLHSFAVPNSRVAGQHSQHFEFVSTDYQNPMPIYRAIQVFGEPSVYMQQCPHSVLELALPAGQWQLLRVNRFIVHTHK
jgi:hypothetical protein